MSVAYKALDNNHRLAFHAMRQGVKVFPCRAATVSNGSAKSPYTRRGFLDATCNVEQLSTWASQYPSAMYGMPCAANGLFVLDADRHGQEDGVATLAALFNHYQLDWSSIPYVRTPNDGLHLIFQRPINLQRSRSKIAPAVDVRDNAYIILPGSIMADGRQYVLINRMFNQLIECIAIRSLPIMPEWLRNIVEHTALPANVEPGVACLEHRRRQLEGILAKVIQAQTGERNAILYWAACRFGEAVAGHVIEFGTAEALLCEAGIICGLSGSEARSTARSGLRRIMNGGGHGR